MSNNIWGADLLKRSEDAAFLTQFLINRIAEREVQGRPKSYVLNLDASWGTGKTFFLTRLRKQLASEGYLTTYVNAWRDDHADTPLTAIMAAIDDTLSPYFVKDKALKEKWSVLKTEGVKIGAAVMKGAAQVVVKKFIGEGLEEIKEIWEGNGSDAPIDDAAAEIVSSQAMAVVTQLADKAANLLLESFRESSQSIESFRAKLMNLLLLVSNDGVKLPLFVLIDELDRCRPTYAIQLLEQVKHLFEVDNVVFIVATDSTQLSHAISAVYGAGFDSRGYLRRFFDRVYRFPIPTMTQFLESQFQLHKVDSNRLSSPVDDNHVQFFLGATKLYGLQLRDVEQCFDLLRGVLTTWQHETKLELCILLPLIIEFQQGMLSGDKIPPRFTIPNGQDAKLWSIRVPVDEYQVTTTLRYQMISTLNFYAALAAAAEKDLQEVSAMRGETPIDQWVRKRLSEEIRIVHGSRFQTGKNYYSVIREYPKYVTSIQRLQTEFLADGDGKQSHP